MVTSLNQVIDFICEEINCRNPNEYGVDINLYGVSHLTDKICELFTKDGEILTYEAQFNDTSCFCWGPTEESHKAWVSQH